MTDDQYESMDMGTWLRLSDAEQLAIMKRYIGERRLAYGKLKERQMDIQRQSSRPRRQMAEQYDAEPAFPAGPVDDRWTASALSALVEHTDRLVAQEAAQRVPELDMNKLDDEQRRAVIACSTREQYELVAAAIRSGKKLPTFAAQVHDRQSIVQLAAPKWSKI